MAKLRKDGKAKESGRPKTITDEWIEWVADQMLDWFRDKETDEDEEQLWLKDFARTITSPVTGMPYSWDGLCAVCEKNQKFSLALKTCKDIQEGRLFKIGLKTKSPMPVFALKNVSGWRDKQEHEHTGKDGGPLQVTVTVVNKPKESAE